MWIANNLATKKSSGVAPMKHVNEGIHPCFETQGRRHQKSKIGVSVAPQKGRNPFFEKIVAGIIHIW